MTTTPNSAVQLSLSAKKNDLLPELNIQMVSIQDLNAAKHGVRKKSNRQISKCRRSIEKFGVNSPALITGDNEIIDGHAMIEAARRIGVKEYPCVVIDYLNDVQVRGLRIARNKIQETGDWNVNELVSELAFQLEFDTDLTDLGFEPPELDNLFEILPEDVGQPDAADEVNAYTTTISEVVTQAGDVWELDKHRIACGNMRDVNLFEALLGNASADMGFADPPYNTKVNGHVRVGKSEFEEFAEASGEMTPAEFIAFLISFLLNVRAVLKDGGLLYCFMDWRHEWELHDAVRASGFEILNKCVWVKPNGGMGSFYRSRHESVFVLKKPGSPHTNNVQLGSNGRNRTNVWEYAGATGGRSEDVDDFTLHPTVKPVRLVQDAILDASALGQTILDPFLGSGTTLLAAERANRICIGLEISPAYVDVAIRRWQDLTGQQAVLRDTGQTFSERSAELSSKKTNSAGASMTAKDDGAEGQF